MSDQRGTLPAEREGLQAHQPRADGVRTVGPGRVERGYLSRIGALEQRATRAERELELAALIERGSARLIDRVETALERARNEENRLLVVLGSLQRENEMLSERAQALEARLARIPAPAARAPGFLARLVGRALVRDRTA